MRTLFHNFDTRVFHTLSSASDLCQISDSKNTYDQPGYACGAVPAIIFQTEQNYSWLPDLKAS